MRFNNPLSIALSALVIATVTACSGDKTAGSINSDSTVTSFEIAQSIKSSTKSFEIKDSESTYYLTKSISIQWPEIFGDYDITPLQDSLKVMMFDSGANVSIVESITAWVDSVDTELFGENATITPIDSIPETDVFYNYEVNITGKLIEFSDKLATYDIGYYYYTGGAHGNSSSHPFTYDLARHALLTVDNMFKPGTRQQLLEAITRELANQLGTTPGRLADAGINTPIEDIGAPYILNGSIVFRYDPYQIAPYSFGAIDVSIYPGEIAELLTAEAAQLLEVDQ